MQIGCWSLNYNTVFIPLNEWFFSYIPDSFLISITYCRFIFIFICSRFNFNFLKLFLHKARKTFVQWNGRQTLLARSLCFTRSRNEPGLFQITAQRLISAPEAASVVNQIPVTQVITSNRTSGNGRACITCWRTVGVVETGESASVRPAMRPPQTGGPFSCMALTCGIAPTHRGPWPTSVLLSSPHKSQCPRHTANRLNPVVYRINYSS